MTSLLLITSLGSIAAVMFMAPWALVFARRPRAALEAVLANWPLLAFPAVAILSTFWSIDSLWSLRAGVQLMATTVIGIWTASCLKPRAGLSALTMALALVALASGVPALGGQYDLEGEHALVGVFDGKNYFAYCICSLMLAAVVVLADRAQHAAFRAVAGLALIGSPYLLTEANSVGAIVVSVTVIVIMALLRIVSLLPRRARVGVFLGVVGVCAPLAIIGLLYASHFDLLLQFLGKDSSLTGRSYIWLRGLQFFEEHPLLGVGYRAFWVVGNPQAEELWFYSEVRSGVGFNFHNLYLNTVVDLGLAGLAVLTATLLAAFARCLSCLLTSVQTHQFFAIGAFLYLTLSSPIEVTLTYQFELGTILLCFIWAHTGAGRHPLRASP